METVPVQTEKQLANDEQLVEYEEATAQSRASQEEVAEDWLRLVYADSNQSSRRAGVIYTSGYEAVQHENPRTGRVEWNRQVEAVRTETGLLLTNNNFDSTGGRFGSSHRNQVRRVLYRRSRSWEPDIPEYTQVSMDLRLVEEFISQFQMDVELEEIAHIKNERADYLITFTDHQQLFIGDDDTARRDRDGRFGFIVDGGRAPSIEDALNMLVPDPVQRAQANGTDVERQGEWFLIPADDGPESRIQKPGMGSKPYGASPLDSHVPRDWATINNEQVIIDEIAHQDDLELAGDTTPEEFADEIDTLQELLEFFKTGQYHYRSEFGIEELRDRLQDELFIRGSVRHRDNEHYQLTLDDWHRAFTHGVEVITVDDTSLMRVRFD
jgi:hypothetical protein